MKYVALISIFVFFFSCTSTVHRKIASIRDCSHALSNFIEVEGLTPVLHAVHLDLNKLKIKHHIVDLDSTAAIELSEEGDHHLSKFIRRIRAINPDVGIYISDHLGYLGQVAYYEETSKGIYIGEHIFRSIKKDKSHIYIPTLMHEARHAQFHYYKDKYNYSNYGGFIESLEEDSTVSGYEKFLSLEESYTYRKEVQSYYAKYLKLKRTGSLELDEIKRTLEFKLRTGSMLSKRILNSLGDLTDKVPTMIIDETESSRYLSYRYTREKEEIIFHILKVDNDFILSQKLQEYYLNESSDFILRQIELIKDDIDYFNYMNLVKIK